MDERTIARILTKHPTTSRWFKGVFASDELPEINRYPAAMVVNLDPSQMPGSHWIALFARNKGHILHFCSYGSRPDGRIMDYLQQYGKITRNQCSFQSFTSQVCGAYTIYVLF